MACNLIIKLESRLLKTGSPGKYLCLLKDNSQLHPQLLAIMKSIVMKSDAEMLVLYSGKVIFNFRKSENTFDLNYGFVSFYINASS